MNSISNQTGIHRANLQTWVRGEKPAGPGGLGEGAGVSSLGLAISARALGKSDTALKSDSKGGAFPAAARQRSGAISGGTAPFKAHAPGANGLPAVQTTPEGKVRLEAKAKPIDEVSFAGGGGKGAILVGVYRGLEKLLGDNVKKVLGTSVGSLTAACYACGLDAATFEKLSRETDMEKLIKDNGLIGNSALGFENLIRNTITASTTGKIDAFMATPQFAALDPSVRDEISRIKSDIQGKGIVTFGQLEKLAATVPGLRSLEVTGTMKPEKGTDGAPELFLFNAKNTPDLDISRAVHASAALPLIFKPVHIHVPGLGKRSFQDGGLRNNLPTSETLRFRPRLDPVPTRQNLAIDFENTGSTQRKIKDGTYKFAAYDVFTKVQNLVAGVKVSRGDYKKNRRMAANPEQYFVVPLKIGKHDMRKLVSGTMHFRITKQSKFDLMNQNAELKFEQHFYSRMQSRAYEFGSREEMFAKVDLETLKDLNASGEPGAAEALAFRADVGKQFAGLEASLRQLTGTPSGKIDFAAHQGVIDQAMKPGGALFQQFQALDGLAGNDHDRAFIGREAFRDNPVMQGFAAMVSRQGDQGLPVLKALGVQHQNIKAQEMAFNLFDGVLSRKMFNQGPGAGGEVLAAAMGKVLAVETPDDLKAALAPVISHFSRKSDELSLHGHKRFAATLQAELAKLS